MIITNISVDNYNYFAEQVQSETGISNPFLAPEWLQVWWEVFGKDYCSYIKIGVRDGNPVAAAPLKILDGIASFIGSPDICDYQDFLIKEGEEEFFSLLLADIKLDGVNRLHLKHLRLDSFAITKLIPVANSLGCRVGLRQEAVCPEMNLPETFDDYLAELAKKERHEIRRKLRRLFEKGNVDFYYTGGKHPFSSEYMGEFLRLIFLNHPAKAKFMTPLMQQFFLKIWEKIGPSEAMRFGCLEMQGEKIAMVLLFDYNNSIFLYNNAYNSKYASLGIGHMSKVLAIKEAIDIGRHRWNFLKGDEEYKRRLGGKGINLYSLEIEIN